MRMWNVDPRILCKNHLLGEHRELHTLVGTINAGISIRGYIDNNLVCPALITSRHAQLVREMRRRGWHHRSPLQEIEYDICGMYPDAKFDFRASLRELLRRCDTCHDRYSKMQWQQFELNWRRGK